jgi:DNA-binding MarR family transcriptional regulator/N-acetylglutamate synthase-like GNAT family acetyltransferase
VAATAGAHHAIDDVRAFNRFYTRVIGVLDGGVVETSYSLPEARVLFELAQVDEGEVGEVRRSLGIDAGYLSRMLARFEAQGLIARRRSAGDARRQLVQLTDLGRSEFAMLDGRSADQVGELIGRLGEGEQRRLVTAMVAIRELLGTAPPAATPVLREPESGDYGWIIERHGALYAAEYGWNSHIESLAARAIGEFMEQRDPARERAWIGEVDGVRAGCVLCARRSDDVAQLRMLIVEPSARGLGLGRMLVDECMRFARDAGYRRMLLWTTNVLEPARRLYQRAGFELVEQAPFQRFGPDLVGEYWRCEL